MPALKAVFDGDADPLARQFSRVDRLAERTGATMQRSLAGGAHGIPGSSGIIRETLVLMREISAGNWTKVPGSLSILLQRMGILKYVLKDNAVAANALAQSLETKAASSLKAALALKAQSDAGYAALATMNKVSVGTLLAVEADRKKALSAMATAEADRVQAVAARESAVAMEAQGTAARFALGPLGWAIAAIVALGTATYFLVGHYKRVREEHKNLADMMDVSHVKFSEQAEILKEAAQEMQKMDDWVRKLAESEETLADKTEAALKVMREQHRMEKEIAEQHHKPKKDILKMELEQLREELQLVTHARLEARRNEEEHEIEALKLGRAANNTSVTERVKNLGEHAKQAGQVVDAIQAKMKNAMFRDGIDAQASQRAAAVSGGFATPVYKYRTANENDRFRVEVNGKAFNMSMKEAKEKFDELSSEEAALARVQTQLKDLYEQKKKLTEKDNADIKRLQKEAAEIKSQIALKEKYGPALAEGGKRMVHGHLTALQQIGAYAPNATLIDVNKKIHHEIKGLRGDLKGALGHRGHDFGKARF